MLTERVVALPYGSGEGSGDRARVRRTRTRARVVDTDSNHKARVWAQLHRLKNVGQILYHDIEGAWIFRHSTPSLRDVWCTNHAELAGISHPAFVGWCRVYRLLGVAAAAVCDGIKWCLIHPVRGPLLILTTTGMVITVAIL